MDHLSEVVALFLRDISTSKNIQVGNLQLTFDISNFIDAKKRMSFTDIALVRLAQVTGYRLITFDKEMLELFKIGPTKIDAVLGGQGKTRELYFKYSERGFPQSNDEMRNLRRPYNTK